MANAQLVKAKTVAHEYLHASAQVILKTLPSEYSEDPHWPRCRRLIQSIARTPHGLSLMSIQDMAIVAYGFGYSGKHLADAQELAHQAFVSTPSLIDDLVKEAIPAFALALLLSSSSDIDALDSIDATYRTLRCLHSLVAIVPLHVLDTIVQSHELFQSLGQCYDTRLSRTDTEMSSIRLRAALAKVSIIDTIHILFTYLISTPSRIASNRLSDLLLTLLELPVSPSSSDTFTPFLNRSLLGDYEASYRISEKLDQILSGDPRMPYITSALKMRAGISSQDANSIGGLSVIFDSAVPSDMVHSIDRKGKGKALKDDDPVLLPAAINPAIQQVLDILPDETPMFIEACLAHPSFSGSVERVIGALVEGGPLPDVLAAMRSMIVNPSPVEEPSLLDSRKNAFDDDPLDFSKVKIGKNRHENVDTVLWDKTLALNMKEDILRRVREQAEEEEEEARQARGVFSSTVAFEDELSGGELEGTPRLKVVQEGEGSVTKKLMGLDGILELAYINDPKLFDRDSGTRRSNARQNLKAETGLGDEQIEGWRIMLERNPKKDYILSKHEFSGNAPLPSGELTEESGRNHLQSSRGRGSHGHGDSGGTSRGGVHNAARDRARKDKAGNQNRKRGHDKKMARGGGIPPS
ncbi:hypothetical protein BS47DRAFT_1337199 [Hydnum rufescens UP504]|uniref:CUE domain-containing protein n=1 Tax=Hydnum rufescens UP504 TaxID=1448309 RepID=A0A9P6BAT9_9AGAM|nr:hypothetical protein BS47DRAFT_1337199 [Hydnum rufescens UP504]